MKIIRYPQQYSSSTSSCVTIGNFDGIHVGHQALINDVLLRANKSGQQSVVVTFNPLPLQYFKGRGAVEILTQFKHKAALLSQMGVDIMCLLNFNEALAKMPAYEFFTQVLESGLNTKYLAIGDDFRFGANREGGFDQLSQWSDDVGIAAKQLQSIEVNGQRVSSSVIRRHLNNAEFNAAYQLLGRHFNLIGRVAHGRKYGREIGFPTINIELRSGSFPLHGIYATHVIIGGTCHQSVTSVGVNPTVGGNAKRVEVHVLDFDRNVYGQTVEVLFYKKLRNEVEFDSLNQLIEAIEQDVIAGRDFFASFTGEVA
jgi:riboflavin kinase/FMN adenylyltransferase